MIWEVKDGGILPFPGNLDDWLYHQKELEAAAAASGSGGRRRARGAGPRWRRPRTTRSAAGSRPRRGTRATGWRSRSAIGSRALEARIEALEQEERAATEALADPALYQDFARAKPLIERQHAAKEELAGLYAEWEAAQEELAALQTGG